MQGITGIGLDSSLARPTDSHLLVLAHPKGVKSARRGTHYPKTDIVVAVVGPIVVASRGATVPRIVVPRTAAFCGLSLLELKRDSRWRLAVHKILNNRS